MERPCRKALGAGWQEEKKSALDGYQSLTGMPAPRRAATTAGRRSGGTKKENLQGTPPGEQAKTSAPAAGALD